MEKKLNLKSEQYFSQFKDSVRQKAIDIGFSELDKINELLEHVYEYDRLVFTKEDISKRKRIKNSIPLENRCIAKIANNAQCTRKRKDGCEYCGTHFKVNSDSIVDSSSSSDSSLQNTKPIDVIARSIGGIVYYIDKYNNVFNTSDILSGVINPSIIGKAKIINGKFHIPDLISSSLSA